MDLLIKAALGGLGFAFMPHRLIDDPQLKQYCVEINVPNSSVLFGLSYSKNSSSSKNSKQFREFISKFFADLK